MDIRRAADLVMQHVRAQRTNVKAAIGLILLRYASELPEGTSATDVARELRQRRKSTKRSHAARSTPTPRPVPSQAGPQRFSEILFPGMYSAVGQR